MSIPPTSSSVEIQAAGGIVERYTPGGIEIAVIHRTRYGSEWCLPKGKLKSGETDTHAALREVQEETGCKADLGEFAGMIQYGVGDKQKQVKFWRMRALAACRFQPSEEVDEIRWLPPDKAVKQLTHSKEAALVQRLYRFAEPCESVGCHARLGLRMQRMFCSLKAGRLESSISAYTAEIERRARKTEVDGGDADWYPAARDLLTKARRALNAGDINTGWKCFNAAQRMEIYGLHAGAELDAKAEALRAEADKLNAWRKKAVDELIGTCAHPKTVISREAVYQAALTRDEHYNNQAYKGDLKLRHMMRLAFLFGAVLVGLILMFHFGQIPSSPPNTGATGGMFVAVALFGLFGSTFSAILKTMNTEQASRIPEMTTAGRVTLLRIFVGAGSAVFVYILINSNLPGVFSSKIQGVFNNTAHSPYTIYIIAFVFGFTERLVLKAVEYVAKRKE